MSSHQGKAIIFSAPSGSGKTTLVRHLLATNSNLSFSVSATTRPPRPGEVHGHDYYFLSPASFKEHIQQNSFVEWEEVYPERYYGTLKSEVERIWNGGRHVIFDIDVKGGLALKEYFGPQALAVFVQAPSLAALKQRLLARASDPSDSINQRLEKAAYEMSFADRFDLIIRNDDLETSKQLAQQAYAAFG
ncbi:MAG: guanylate kinase [Tunicatimonas sp.]